MFGSWFLDNGSIDFEKDFEPPTKIQTSHIDIFDLKDLTDFKVCLVKTFAPLDVHNGIASIGVVSPTEFFLTTEQFTRDPCVWGPKPRVDTINLG